MEKLNDIQIETCKFYISNIKFYSNSSVLYGNSNFYKLIDFKSDTSVVITTQIPSNIYVDAISFDLGIDSNVNKQGIQGGDLDPTMGMYWSWQSGYINFKLEGILGSFQKHRILIRSLRPFHPYFLRRSSRIDWRVLF